jgi:hypothetical protein
MNYNNFWDNVLKQEEWNDDLKRWENAHPEYEPFKEDSDSQRQQNLLISLTQNYSPLNVPYSVTTELA